MNTSQKKRNSVSSGVGWRLYHHEKDKFYNKPLVILVNHWTGSIAEAITIGFDAFRRPTTTIIGTEMARLNGAVYSYQMPNTRIGFSFTSERLYTV